MDKKKNVIVNLVRNIILGLYSPYFIQLAVLFLISLNLIKVQFSIYQTFLKVNIFLTGIILLIIVARLLQKIIQKQLDNKVITEILIKTVSFFASICIIFGNLSTETQSITSLKHQLLDSAILLSIGILAGLIVFVLVFLKISFDDEKRRNK